MEQLRRIDTLLRQRALGCEGMPYAGGRLRGGHGAAGKRFKKAGNTIDKLGAQFSKLFGTHGQRRLAIFQTVIVAHGNPRQNSIRSSGYVYGSYQVCPPIPRWAKSLANVGET